VLRRRLKSSHLLEVILSITQQPVTNPHTGRIIVVDKKRHRVVECDWNGDITWQFGELDTPGSDLAHLNLPKTACVAEEAPAADPPYSVMIADKTNDRVLQYAPPPADEIRRMHIVPYPASMTWNSRTARWCVASEIDLGCLVYGYDGLWWYSWWGGAFSGTITDESTLLTNQEEDLWEIDLRSHKPPYRMPLVRRYLNKEKSLAAGESVTQPFYAFGCGRAVVTAKTSEDATLDILSLRLGSDDTILESEKVEGGSWEVYDSVSLTANTVEIYPISSPHGVMAARITMGSTAGDVLLLQTNREVVR